MKRTALLLALALLNSEASALEVRPFTPDSYAAIVEHHAGRPFLLLFWSLECPPCYRELEMLGEAGAGRAFPTVIVSTDGTAAAGPIAQTLERFGLQAAEAWTFAAPDMALRFAVDRTWYGELPRSYLFDAEGGREAVTGVLEHARLEQWLAR